MATPHLHSVYDGMTFPQTTHTEWPKWLHRAGAESRLVKDPAEEALVLAAGWGHTVGFVAEPQEAEVQAEAAESAGLNGKKGAK